MHKARTAIAKALVIATALAAFAPSMAKAGVENSNQNVAFSATVQNVITLTVDQASMTFGNLSASTSRWAGNGSGADSQTKGNTFTLSTNATTGASLKYSGSTLTSGGNTITGIGGTGKAPATAGSAEEFGISVNSTALTENSEYQYNATVGSAKYAFQTGDTVASVGAPVNAGTVDAYYVANIEPVTEAGSYTTTLTFSATATF